MCLAPPQSGNRSYFVSYDFRQIRPINAVFTNILSAARTLPIGTEVNRE
jgi:hypothetical protein